MPIIADTIKYARFALGLREFLHGTISLEQSKQAISARLQNREKNFLSLLQKGIYQNPKSPYLELLRMSGCEFGDIESLVNQDGIEPTLHKLLAEGVYLSWEEFKGKRDVVRGGHRFQFRERDFDNPFLPGYYQVKSSGSRSTGTRTTFDLNHQIDKSYYHLLMLAVNNALDVPHGLWQAVPPSGTGIGNVLRHWVIGQPIAKWFSPVAQRQVQSLRDRVFTIYCLYGSRLWGARLAKPEYVSIIEAIKVARWIAATNQQFGGCSFNCPISLAVKVCQAAIENGLDIQGTHFFSGGEPLTEAKRQQIETAGARVTSKYSMSEVGKIGFGCPGSSSTDDVHYFHDSVALIQHKRKVKYTDIYVNAFVFTSLLPVSIKILINVESDDYGAMETRSCGCLLEQMGFNRHLYNIRSFAKLTGIGTTIVGSDFVRILEEVLPQRYGGGATDYQLLEEEDGQGQTHLSLTVSPEVGVIDEGDVIATLLDELRKDIANGKLTAALWSQAKVIKLKREYPFSTSSGKVVPLHLVRKDD